MALHVFHKPHLAPGHALRFVTAASGGVALVNAHRRRALGLGRQRRTA